MNAIKSIIYAVLLWALSLVVLGLIAKASATVFMFGWGLI